MIQPWFRALLLILPPTVLSSLNPYFAMIAPLKKTMCFLSLCASPLLAELAPINDAALVASFVEGLGAFADAENPTTADFLSQQAASAPSQVEGLSLAASRPVELSASVYLVGSVYKCDKCDRWHPSSIASAWALTRDGVMVTNYHVFEKAKGGSMGVVDRHGNASPITEVLAVDKPGDVAIFRVEAEALAPLPIGAPAKVGSPIRVISHPGGLFYMQTLGHVARYHVRRSRGHAEMTPWMTITADYARGSSGGPVLDEEGRVVGMVSRTQPIYTQPQGGAPREGEDSRKRPSGSLQMVIKDCVPIAAIRNLVDPESSRDDEAKPKTVVGVPMFRPEPRPAGEAQREAIPRVPGVAAAEPRKNGPGPDSLIGKPLPEFALPTIEGTELTNASVKGKVVLIDFWASWCGPCKAAAPILQKIHEEYSERGLLVIGANTSERGPEGTPLMTSDIAAAYAKEHGYTYAFTYGSDPFKEASLVSGLPTMLIVDQEGLVRHAVIGFAKDLEANLVQKIKPLISEE